MQTNETRNAVIHYRRSPNGELTEVERTSTGRAGSGTFKPISGRESAPNAFEGAGSVILSPDRRFLFTTNGGDNSVSSFAIGEDGRLTLPDVEATGNRRRSSGREGAGSVITALLPRCSKKISLGIGLSIENTAPPCLGRPCASLRASLMRRVIPNYWIHGHSTERDFIYVTTQTLTRERLQKISNKGWSGYLAGKNSTQGGDR